MLDRSHRVGAFVALVGVLVITFAVLSHGSERSGGTTGWPAEDRLILAAGLSLGLVGTLPALGLRLPSRMPRLTWPRLPARRLALPVLIFGLAIIAGCWLAFGDRLPQLRVRLMWPASPETLEWVRQRRAQDRAVVVAPDPLDALMQEVQAERSKKVRPK